VVEAPLVLIRSDAREGDGIREEGQLMKSGIFGLPRHLVQIRREVYQILQLLARWQIYDNASFCGETGKLVIDKIGRFRESTRKTGQNAAFSVG